MQKPQDHWARYEPHLRRVIAHVHDHLDEPLDLNVLADIACLSPHHWHRVYHAMTGETLAQTVKRLRLNRAAGQLAGTAVPVSRVAQAAGYPNLQSFNRTFKSVYGLPPARFREQGSHHDFDAPCAAPASSSFAVTVQQLGVLPLLAVGHRGSYMAIGRAFDLLFTRIAAAGLARPGLRMLALFFDDPGVTPEADLHAQAAVAGCAESGSETSGKPGAEAGAEPDAERGLLHTALVPGEYAVLAHTGPYASMKAAYQWLYGHWLPQSGREPGDGPIVEEYLNSPRDTAPRDLRTLIHLPLRAVPNDGA